MGQNILRLVNDFKKKLRSEDSDDPTVARIQKGIKIAKEINNTEGIKLHEMQLDKYLKQHKGDLWELFKHEMGNNFVMALELQEHMHNMAVDAGYTPRGKINTSCRRFLITLRPPQDVTWDDFYKKTQKYITRNFFISRFAVYEQSGNTPEAVGDGFHMHIMCECKYIKTKVLQDTISTFKDMIGDSGIDIKLIKTDKSWDNVYNYLTVSKFDDPDKQAAAVLTEEWREKVGLPKGYPLNFTLPKQALSGKDEIIDITEID